MTETTHARLIRENEELRRMLAASDAITVDALNKKLAACTDARRKSGQRLYRLKIAAQRVLTNCNFHAQQTPEAMTSIKHLLRLTK